MVLEQLVHAAIVVNQRAIEDELRLRPLHERDDHVLGALHHLVRIHRDMVECVLALARTLLETTSL